MAAMSREYGGSIANASCRMTAPESTPSSTKCTVTPVIFEPWSIACCTASMPGNAGRRAGCTLMTRFRNRATNSGESNCM